MDEFYKGQKVHCKRNGDGVITAISNAYEDYPIIVIFDSGHCESYTRDGKILIGTRETHLTQRGEEVMSKDFYVGQRVWCAIYGAGVVQRIHQQSGVKYPVVAVFKNNGNGNVAAYTSDGKYHDDGNVTLYTYPIEIVKAITKNLCEELKHLRDEVKTLREALKTCQSKPQELKPSIDWDHINENSKWLAMDADGECYIYTDKPLQGERQWTTNLPCSPAINFTSFTPGTCDWRDSLVKRPD